MSDKPNILFVITDDLGVDVLKFINDEAVAQAPGTKKYKLPNLSKLLKSGVNFTRTWSHPVCSPARATMFTGMHPWQNGVGFAGFAAVPLVGTPFTEKPASPNRQKFSVYEIPLTTELGEKEEKVETYADTLKAAGYTCSFFGKWDQGYMLTKFGQTEADKNGPIDRGWDYFAGVMGGGVDPRASATVDLDPRLYWTWVKEIQDVNNQKDGRPIQTFQKSPEADAVDVNYPMAIEDQDGKLLPGFEVKEPRKHAYATADSIHSAREWIKNNAGTPWCTTLALHAPHYPYHVPPAGTYTIDEFIDTADNLNKIGNSGKEEQTKFVAMVESMDHYLGELLNAPDLQEELKNTVIIFIGDNGSPSSVVDLDSIKEEGDPDSFEKDPIKEGKRSIYMPGVNVPLVVADGGSLAGASPCYLDGNDLGTDNTSLVQAADLFSTITEMGQGERESKYDLDSYSLLPYLQDDAPAAVSRQYNFGQYFVNIEISNPVTNKVVKPYPTNRATISDGEYKLNFRGKVKDVNEEGLEEHEQEDVYEFAKLETDPVTGFQVERYLDDFNHPKAKELLGALQTQFRASSGAAGQRPGPTPEEFPDFPAQFNRLIRVPASGTATQQLAGFGTVRSGQLQVGGLKQMPGTIGELEAYRGKVTFDLSHIQNGTVKKASLFLSPTELEAAMIHVEPLKDAVSIYPPEASDSTKRISMKMGGDDRYELDVTEIVNGWLANPASNLGFRVFMHDLTASQAEIWRQMSSYAGGGNRMYSTSSGMFASYGASMLGSFPEPEVVFTNHQNTVFGPVLVIESNEVIETESVIGETGSVTCDQANATEWHTVELKQAYTDPVVVMGPVSFNGSHSVTVRVKNVTADSFQFQLDEWTHLDDVHTTETIGYMVMEAGTHTLSNGMKIAAGSTSTDHNWKAVNFAEAFSEAPIVISQCASYAGSDPVVTRQKGISSSSFQVRLQEEEARGDHVQEEVMWIAVEKGDFTSQGISLISASTQDQVTHEWSQITWNSTFTDQVFIAAMQTCDGTDTATLRYKDLSCDSVSVFVEEEKSKDTEKSHTTEAVGYIVFNGSGLLTA